MNDTLLSCVRNIKSVLIFTFLVICFSSLAQSKCVLKKDQDSVKVYACDDGKQQFKSISATFTVDATLSELVAMQLDAENYTQWQYHTIKARILKKINDQEMIYHTVIAAPWPVTDRDLVVHFTVKQDLATKTVIITANSVPDFIPKINGLVRVPSSTSQWTVVPVAPGRVKVSYTMLIDPGGSVPAWMVNMVVTQAPFESFENFKERIKKGKPKLPRASFIID